MELITESNTRFDGIKSFDVHVSYQEIDGYATKNTSSSHVHNECEIYICVAGKISFVVEDKVYPVLPGEMIITRPYEYHHCMCHSNEKHKHFCIWFSSNGNESILEPFFNRELGVGNLLTLPVEKHNALFELAQRLMDESKTEFSKLYDFMQLISYVRRAEAPEPNKTLYSHDVYSALNYINQHFTEQISIKDLARDAHVSLSTLERHFFDAIRMTPSSYLKNKRLANAAEMLYNGSSVIESCYKSGFSDQSKYINMFKKNYGYTPLQYKKRVVKENVNRGKAERVEYYTEF